MKLNKTITTILLMFGTQAFAAVEKALEAHANLESKNGSKVIGTAEFKQLPEGLEIQYKILGLAKNGTFGFHIHEKGDCSSKDAKSAGSHYHKIAEAGGTSLETPQAFAGDLPALISNDKGIAQGRLLVANLSLADVNPVQDRAVMIHGGPDDITKTSAPRVSCGVIKVVQAKK